MQLVQFVRDSLALLFPELCIGCKQVLVYQENHLCTNCIYNLPETNFHLDPDNLAGKQLKGRVPVLNVSSFLYFSSGSIVQRIIHHIKYKDGFAAAEWLGELYGQQLKNSILFPSNLTPSNLTEPLDKSSVFSDCQIIIPVPLHKKRLRSRGYNQSDYLAKEISKALGIETDFNNLVRTAHNESQTKSTNRFERFENIHGIFKVNNPELLENKHILLVDDVLTTGATLEACCIALLQIPNVKVSVATL